SAAALLATAIGAQAADLPLPRPTYTPPVMVPLFTWTGFYVGGNLGAAWLQGNLTWDFDGSTWGRTNAQFIGGGQVGFNYQIGSFVAGVEGDFDWTSGRKSTPFVTVGNQSLRAVAEWNWVTTLAARLGFAWDHTLFYGKIGYGWSRTSVNLEDSSGFAWC